MGDRTNLVMILAGELLRKAEYLLTMGLHPSEVVLGYELARDRAIEELESELGHAFVALGTPADLVSLCRVVLQDSGNTSVRRQLTIGLTAVPGLKAVRIRRSARQTCCRSSPRCHAKGSQECQFRDSARCGSS